MTGRLAAYYDGVDDLCAQLTASGRSDDAERLRTAKDGGSTSGEILSHTGALLRTLSKDGDRDLRRQARELLNECHALWQVRLDADV